MSDKATMLFRRQFERTSARAPVFVHCRGRFQRAMIADYSQVGLQLQGTFGLIRNDPVLIELISGVRIEGKVEWSLGVRTGVVFLEPLQPSDPAMQELARQNG
jgi:hypothetical protein